MRIEPGQRALVTGGSRGLGLEIARALASRGMDLVLVARTPSTLVDAAAAVKQAGAGHVQTLLVDLADPHAVERLSSAAWNVDVLVNNVGMEKAAIFEERPPSEILAELHFNLAVPIALTRAFLPAMIRQGGGHIVNVASAAGLVPTAYQEPYSAAKAGLVAFSRALRMTGRMENWGVGVTALCPGFIEGDGMFARLQAEHGFDPALFGASPISEVGIAVLDAIERNLAVSVVAPVSTQLAAAALATDSPGAEDALPASPAFTMFGTVARKQNDKRKETQDGS